MGLQNLGTAGSHFSRDTFASASQLTFASTRVKSISSLAGVKTAVVDSTPGGGHLDGHLRRSRASSNWTARWWWARRTAQYRRAGDHRQRSRPDTSRPRSRDVGTACAWPLLLAHDQTRGDPQHQLCARKGIKLGSTIKLGGKTFTVIGFAKTPLGGQASDVVREARHSCRRCPVAPDASTRCMSGQRVATRSWRSAQRSVPFEGARSQRRRISPTGSRAR